MDDTISVNAGNYPVNTFRGQVSCPEREPPRCVHIAQPFQPAPLPPLNSDYGEPQSGLVNEIREILCVLHYTERHYEEATCGALPRYEDILNLLKAIRNKLMKNFQKI